MKTRRFIYMVCIVISITIIGIWEQNIADDYLHSIESMTLKLQTKTAGLENINTADILIDVYNIGQKWENFEFTLCFITNIKDIREMGNEISRLESNVETNQIDDFAASLNLIIRYTKHYHNVMGVSWENIL